MSKSSVSLGLHAAALVVIYSVYGLLQEKILKGVYANDEKFTSSPILVLCNRIFSTCVGLGIALSQAYFKRNDVSTGPTRLSSALKPASSIYAYAALAVLNFLSTFCQYEALRYVGFTSQALAKCAKMVPVLIIGRLVYKKQHSAKQWIAAWVVILGIATYLFSRPNVDTLKADGDDAWLAGVIGTLLLLGYLGFDRLTSTTQEKVFGKNPDSSNPFGPDSPVLDQMIYVNAFAAGIAFLGSLASFTTIGPSISLMLRSPALVGDIILLSATSAIGLIVLLNTIAAFGALTSSTIMTCRQFFSILLNAGAFGNFGSLGPGGLLGVMWVFSGIWIKMNRSWDTPKKTGITLSQSMETLNSDSSFDAGDKEALLVSPLSSPIRNRKQDPMEEIDISKPSRRPLGSYFLQYGLPLVIPVFIASIAGLYMAGLHISVSATMEEWENSDEVPGLSAMAVNLPAEKVVLEAGLWGSQLHALTNASCPTGAINTTFYPDRIPTTALATYPRSGNSYIRGLIERATTYRTSSVYCDRTLSETFRGECSDDPFLRKTHHPDLSSYATDNVMGDQYWRQFDRAVHLIRNPLDEVFSYWNYRQTHDHEGRVEGIANLGSTRDQRHSVLKLARGYVEHDTYWAAVPLLKHEVRYEDLRSSPIPTLMSLLNFLLPQEHLPSLGQLACVVELNEEAEAYKSRKSNVFSSWDKFDPDVRQELLEVVRGPWCRFGFDVMLEEALGEKPVDCKK